MILNIKAIGIIITSNSILTRKKRYEILKTLPTYGMMYTSVTENNEPFYSEGFVIRMFKTDTSEWIANFQPGWTNLYKVYEFEDTPDLLVIAGGTCYFIDPDECQAKSVFGVDYESVLLTNENQIILQSSTGLTIVESNKEYWHTERISFDGIKDLFVEGDFVRGVSYMPDTKADLWLEFSVDLNQRKVYGGSFNDSVKIHNADNIPWLKRIFKL
ncbi:MAG: hypothetical protein ACO1O6_13795 [Bacteroidota bacterium]